MRLRQCHLLWEIKTQENTLPSYTQFMYIKGFVYKTTISLNYCTLFQICIPKHKHSAKVSVKRFYIRNSSQNKKETPKSRLHIFCLLLHYQQLILSYLILLSLHWHTINLPLFIKICIKPATILILQMDSYPLDYMSEYECTPVCHAIMYSLRTYVLSYIFLCCFVALWTFMRAYITY